MAGHNSPAGLPKGARERIEALRGAGVDVSCLFAMQGACLLYTSDTTLAKAVDAVNRYLYKGEFSWAIQDVYKRQRQERHGVPGMARTCTRSDSQGYRSGQIGRASCRERV